MVTVWASLASGAVTSAAVVACLADISSAPVISVNFTSWFVSYATFSAVIFSASGLVGWDISVVSVVFVGSVVGVVYVSG